MEKNRIEIAKRLGIKVKTNSESPGMYINSVDGKRKVDIAELFPEFKELNQYSFTVNYKDLTVHSVKKEKPDFAPEGQTFSKSHLLVGAS